MQIHELSSNIENLSVAQAVVVVPELPSVCCIERVNGCEYTVIAGKDTVLVGFKLACQFPAQPV